MSNTLRTLKSFRELIFADKILFLRMLSLCLFIRALILTRGFNITIRFLTRFIPKQKVEIANQDYTIERHKRLMNIFVCFPFYIHNCLSISTGFWYVLKKKGIDVKLIFGMRRVQEALRAHAWLEYNGSPMTEEKQLAHFTSFHEPIL